MLYFPGKLWLHARSYEYSKNILVCVIDNSYEYSKIYDGQIIWIFKEYRQIIWIFEEYNYHMWNRQQMTVKDYTVPL